MGALNQLNISKSTNNSNKLGVEGRSDEIKKRLFDYKPFSSMDSFDITAGSAKSDFIYSPQSSHQHPRTTILVREQSTKKSSPVVETLKNQHDEDEYDEDDDDEYDEDEDEDEEDEEDDEDIESDYEDEEEEIGEEEDGDGSSRGRGGENRSALSVEMDRQSLPVGADEEDVRSAAAAANANVAKPFAMITPIGNRFFSLVKRVGNTIESSQKIQNVKGYITDKSSQIKDVSLSSLI